MFECAAGPSELQGLCKSQSWVTVGAVGHQMAWTCSKSLASQSTNRAKRRNGDRPRTARRARKRLLTRPQHCYALLTDLGQAPVTRSCRGTIISMSPVDIPHSRAPETRSTFPFIGPGYTAKGVLRLGTREEPVGRGRLQHHIFRSILASIDAVHL